MRGSSNKIRNEKARHIVSLFLSQEKITLAQTQVEDKSNEIPALLELLDALKLDNCVITMDALHTQKKR
jgi:sulfur relay (sulfurtransferase) complex TusBCD TusD component (DsrE family)